jgi:hypothetical protein
VVMFRAQLIHRVPRNVRPVRPPNKANVMYTDAQSHYGHLSLRFMDERRERGQLWDVNSNRSRGLFNQSNPYAVTTRSAIRNYDAHLSEI